MDGTLRIVESQLPKCKSKNLEIISNLFLANEGGFLHPLIVPAGFFCSCLVCWILVPGTHGAPRSPHDSSRLGCQQNKQEH